MTIENILLCVLAFLFLVLLYKNLGSDSEKRSQLPEKFCLFSEKTGQIIEMRLLRDNRALSSKQAIGEEFIARVKIIFKTVCESFAEGNTSVLKNYMEPAILEAFEADIRKRKSKKETMEFSLICFDSVEIESVSPGNDEITVSFVTEQINLLKNSKNEVKEGDPMVVAKVRDFWTFRKSKHNKWLVSATQSEGIYE